MKSLKKLAITIFLIPSILLVSCKTTQEKKQVVTLSKEEEKKIFDKSKELIDKNAYKKFNFINDKNEQLDKISLEMFVNSQKLYGDDKNFVFSPFSVQRALGLMAENIEDKNDLEFLKIYDMNKILDRNFAQTKLGNLILVNNKAIKELKKDSENIKSLNFPDQALEEYKKLQKNVLDEVLDEEPFDDVVLSLIDVISYEGKWDKPFDVSKTKDKEFTTSSGEKVKAPTMSQHFDFSNGIADDKVEAVFMTSKNSKVYFIKVKDKNLRTAESLYNIMDDLDKSEHVQVNFEVPKINTRTTQSILHIFNQFGMDKVFKTFKLDKLSDVDLTIDKAKQMATLEIDEFKAKAKAVTKITNKSAAPPTPQKVLDIKMDSPFYVIIKDADENNEFENIIFTSYIENPLK